jgi:membrane protease YdiL (CAAX protease family)
VDNDQANRPAQEPADASRQPQEPYGQQVPAPGTGWQAPAASHNSDAVAPPPYGSSGEGPQGSASQPPYAPYSPYPPNAAAPWAPSQAQPSTSPRRYVVPVGLTVLGLAVVAALVLLGGDAYKFLSIGVLIAPLAILAALAYGGVKSIVAMVFTYVWLAILALGALVNALGSVLLAFVQSLTPLELKPGAFPVLGWTALLLALVTLVSATMLLRPVRVLVSRFIPIDPDNFVHKIALSMLTLITLSSFVPLIALGGRPPLLELITQGNSGTDLQDLGVSAGPLDLLYQFVWTIPATFIAAGWPIARNFPAVLQRLGMVRPSVRQALFGIGAGVALAFLAGLVIDPGVHWIWTTLGWAPTDTAAFEQLLGDLINPLGAVIIGVTAGVGEEMAVRGLLQPRFGLVVSNLFFTSLHASQYGFDALLSVFIIGLILGIIRARSNTTTSAIVHGVYDFVLVMASVLT